MKRSIAYTSNWLHTLMLSCILAFAIVFILIFLQPFDSYQSEMPFKNLKLFGYSACIILPIMFIHIFEELWFKFSNGKWYVYQEIISLFIGLIFIITASFFYNTIVVNDININLDYILRWAVVYGLPFVPIFIPLWIFLRFKFSTITILPQEGQSEKEIVIKGNSQEEIRFAEDQFLLAKSQANYVDIFYLKDEQIHKEMIRFTISGLVELIPSALQIHRSYLVNPAQIKSISGNTRKGNIQIKQLEEEIPISPKHFIGVKKYLQTRPKSSF